MVFNPPSQPTNCSHQRNPKTLKISSSDIFFSFTPNSLFLPPPFFRLNPLLAMSSHFPLLFKILFSRSNRHATSSRKTSLTPSLVCLHVMWLGLFCSEAGQAFQLHGPGDVSIGMGSHTQSGLYVYRSSCQSTQMPLLAEPSIGESHLLKQAHEHPETKEGLHLSISLCLPSLQMAKGEGRERRDEPSP